MSYLEHLSTLGDKFRHLDELPEELYSTIVIHSHGELKQRIQGILQWRSALLEGLLPNENQLVWPDTRLRRMVLKRLEVLEIVQYCKAQVELTDSILKDVCEAISSAELWQEIDPGFDDKLAREQKRRDKDSPFDDSGRQEFEVSNQQQQNQAIEQAEESLIENEPVNSSTQMETSSFDESIIEDSVLENSLLEDSLLEDSLLEERWQELSQEWQELESVFSELSSLLGRGWDLTQGLLASQGWRDIIRYRKLVRDLPWLEQVIASLGRLREKNSDDPSADNELSDIANIELESISEQVFEPIKRLVDEEVDVRTPHAVFETSGIRRSDDISRLLPGELAQLGHPQLNLLWHAKRAEHTLLTYQVDGVLSEHEPIEQELLEETTQNRQELPLVSEQGYGPIIVCLDSSASMQGEPENIAKALVLEALKIAWQEDRACYVYLFSGPDQLLQHNLDLSKGGLAELLAFLTQTFHGGTDIIGPLTEALSQQKHQNWQEADILLVTDGRFPVSQLQKQQIKTMKEQSQSRIHGVLIGNWKALKMQTICDNFHRVC